MFKLGFIPVLVMGLSIGAIILSWAYFWNYQPDVLEAKYTNDQAVLLQNNANGRPAADKRLKLATDMVNQASAKWQDIVAVKTPPQSLAQGGINMAVSAWQMTIDARVFRNSIQRAINKQLKVGGVKVINGPMVPMPSEDASAVVSDFFNYPAIPFPVVVFDLGQVTVQGTYSQIVTNMSSWSSMPNYLAVADGLALTGTAPILTGTYNVTVVGYIRGHILYPTVQQGISVAGLGSGGPSFGNGSGAPPMGPGRGGRQGGGRPPMGPPGAGGQGLGRGGRAPSSATQ